MTPRKDVTVASRVELEVSCMLADSSVPEWSRIMTLLQECCPDDLPPTVDCYRLAYASHKDEYLAPDRKSSYARPKKVLSSQ